jgi:hypothetical protein
MHSYSEERLNDKPNADGNQSASNQLHWFFADPLCWLRCDLPLLLQAINVLRPIQLSAAFERKDGEREHRDDEIPYWDVR